MGTLMSDLVKVVPPTEEAEKSKTADAETADAKSPAKTPGGLKATATRVPAKRNGKTTDGATDTTPSLQAASTDEEEFDWDEAGSSVGGGLETTTAPPTASYEDDDGLHATTITDPAAPANAARGDDDDEDSDWE